LGEVEIAQRTAEWLGVKFVKAHMSESELASRFEDAVYHCEHHNPDLNFVGKYALSEVPRQYGYKVVLTGEGSDEQFAGYPQFLPDYLSGLDLPDEERRGLVRESEEAIKTLYQDMGATSRFFEEENKLNLSIPASMLAFAPPQTIFAPWARKQFGKIDPVDTVSNNLDGVARDRIRDRWHPLNSAMYTWSKGNLVNQFLSCLGDRVEMAHSIEARTPFLDHHLTTYVNSLPPDLKLHPDPTNKGKYIEKYALREAMKEFVTPEIYARRKHAYSAPTKFDTGGPIRSMLERMVTREGVEALGFMDWEEVEGLMGRAFGGEGEARAWRVVLIVAEWVVLGKRFGVKKAGGTEDEGKRGV